MRYQGFLGGSAPSQSRLATSERAMNCYIERITTQGSQNRAGLYPTPGFSTWCSGLADLGGRAALSIDGHTWAVMGAGLYELQSSGTAVRKASLTQDNNPAQIAYNGPTGGQLCIASGGHAEIYSIATGVLTRVLSGEATQVGMLDEYFLALNQATGKLRLSNLNDGLTWDPLQFALRSAQPDPWQAMIINPPDIWLLGTHTGDIWYDAGTSPFPLAARSGLTIPYGIAAPFSLALTGGKVLWLTNNKDGAGEVVLAQGYTPQPITSPELATALSTYVRVNGSLAATEGWTYQQEGHTFYVLRLPTGPTWVYDLTTGIWAERGKWNSATNAYDVWAPRIHVYAFGKHLVADNATGSIAAMDVTFGSEADGTAIRRIRRGPVVVNENTRIPIKRFELGLEVGVGAVSGQGSTPKIMGRFSTDGGATWGTERTASLGKLGAYKTRVFFTRCGSPRLWVPEISLTDPVPWRIVDAYLNNEAA